jgi:hypothetical protein
MLVIRTRTLSKKGDDYYFRQLSEEEKKSNKANWFSKLLTIRMIECANSLTSYILEVNLHNSVGRKYE